MAPDCVKAVHRWVDLVGADWLFLSPPLHLNSVCCFSAGLDLGLGLGV